MKHFRILFSILFLAVFGDLYAEATYHLEAVTSVEAGALYVFEQDGYVMGNSISSKSLQTTRNFSLTALEGTEAYVWTLEAAQDGFYMKNVSLSSNAYLNNTSGKTDMSFGSKSAVWAFNFESDGTATIQNVTNNNRYLGLNSYKNYKAYASSDMSLPHAITVYQLVEGVGEETLLTGKLSIADVEVEKGRATLIEVTTNSDGTITFSPDVVTEENGQYYVTVTEDTEITATIAATERYTSASTTFKATVKATAVAGDALLYESWSKSTAKTDGTSELPYNSANLDSPLWDSFSKVYQGAYQCGKLGSSSAVGKMVTKSIGLNGDGTLTFKIRKYGSDTGKLKVSVSGATIDGDYQFAPQSTEEWTDCSVRLTGGNGSVVITLATTAKRMYIDDIMLVADASPTVQLTVGSAGAVSFSSSQALDFSQSALKAYIVTAKNGSSFLRQQVMQVPAHTGLVVEGAPGDYDVPVIAEAPAIEDNLLQATSEPAYTVKDTDYGCVYGLFYSYNTHKVGFKLKETDFTFGAGKSYLRLSEAQAKDVIYIDEEVTGVEATFNVQRPTFNVYNLNGQRVPANQRGVVIVNGRKVLNR